jgi:hypothetical protein
MNPPTAASDKIHFTDRPPCCERAGAISFWCFLVFAGDRACVPFDEAEGLFDRLLRA